VVKLNYLDFCEPEIDNLINYIEGRIHKETDNKDRKLSEDENITLKLSMLGKSDNSIKSDSSNKQSKNDSVSNFQKYAKVVK
jgi:hypothetical protein